MSTRTHFCKSLLLLIIAAAPSFALHAQPTEKAAREAAQRAEINARIVMQLQQAMAGGPAARQREKECEILKECPVEVDVMELYDVNHKLKFCAVQSDNIKIKTPASVKPKKDDETIITLTLKVPPTIATYEFADLVTFNDDETALDKATLKLSNAKKTLSIKHKHKKTGYELHYFPAVIQTIGTGAPLMCAAIDPKIINE